ncbi:MAG: TnpV protein [Lachnospiraceae bacterium]|nr:TnpV protein [Lachnospiraceae bacterium]MCI9307668.1 TnpV protein [Lachnospiraceae bacterium]
MQYFSGNGHLQKYNICGWLICGEWKLSDTTENQIGKYGRMRQRFLKENHRGIYSYMILSEILWKHLAEIDENRFFFINRISYSKR